MISNASIFLPRYSGVRPTIRPATNTAIDDEHQHAVEPRADAAEDDFAQLHQPHRHQAAERRERIVHGIDRAVRGGGGRSRPQGGIDDAEARFLAFHVAAGLGCRRGLDPRRASQARDCRPAPLAHIPPAAATSTKRHRRRARPSLGACRPPCRRRCSTARPGSAGSPASRGSSRAASDSRKGCAELTLKKPPPLVPSCLMAICDAAGPTAITCSLCVAFSVTGLPLASLTGWPAASSLGLSYVDRLQRAARSDRRRRSAPRPG